MSEMQKWVQMALPDSTVAITLVTWFPEMPPGCIRGLIIRVDDIESEIASLNNKGVKVEPVQQTPWGQFATVKDPDGNSLSLHQERGKR